VHAAGWRQVKTGVEVLEHTRDPVAFLEGDAEVLNRNPAASC
jgi:hypothetical protein